ncbi:acyltransferase [Anaerorhabdus sp.]|uniref:acyltransferase n=1 Tax=Anaerorhabdus sp. TaxID=1872524 RepID=UPI002FC5B564
MKKREVSIDLIKIIASFAVICLHLIDIPSNKVDQWVYYLSGCAIPLLLMVNGYLLLNKDKITFKRQSLKSLKMLGVVFLWCLIYSCINYFTTGSWVNPIQTVVLGLMQKGNMWQFWFIGTLILIHLFLPLLHRIFIHPKTAFLIIVLCFLICFGIDIINVLFVAVDKPLIQSYVPQTFRLWNHFAYFFLGGFLGKPEIKEIIKSEIKIWKHLIFLIVITIAVVNYEMFMGVNYYGTTYAEFFYDNAFVMIWIVTLFSFLNRLDIKNNGISKFVSYISVNTFGVYVMHVYLMSIMQLIFDYKNQQFTLLLPFVIFVIAQVISSILRMNKATRVLVTF